MFTQTTILKENNKSANKLNVTELNNNLKITNNFCKNIRNILYTICIPVYFIKNQDITTNITRNFS